MPQKQFTPLSAIRAQVITFSDRVLSGEKPDRAGPLCASLLAEAGLGDAATWTIAEDESALDQAISASISGGFRLVIVLGGSGFGVGNVAPEVVRRHVKVEIPGIAEQMRAHGCASTPLSGLSRSVVGVTARDSSGALLVSSPGSTGGVQDTLAVLIPLLGAIYSQLDEPR